MDEVQPKPYLVLFNDEGWSLDEVDTFEEAIKLRENLLFYGHNNIVIAKRVNIKVTEDK